MSVRPPGYPDCCFSHTAGTASRRSAGVVVLLAGHAGEHLQEVEALSLRNGFGTAADARRSGRGRARYCRAGVLADMSVSL